LEQFHFLFIQSRYWCGPRVYFLTYLIYSLYLSYFLHFWKKNSKSFTKYFYFHSFFVNDSLFISQEKSYEKSNTILFSSYSIISSLFKQFGLTIEYKKSEVFYFSRFFKNFNPSPLDLSSLGSSILWPKDNWKYLGFIFNRKLLFWQYFCFYSNKFCTEHSLYPLPFMAFLYSTSKVLLYSTLSMN